TFTDSAGDAAFSIVDARDVAAAAACALTEPGHDGRAYALSGPAALTDSQLAAVLSEAAGRPIRYVEPTDAEYEAAKIGAGMDAADARDLVDMNHYYRAGRGAEVTRDVERATGSAPRSFENFAREYASVWK